MCLLVFYPEHVKPDIEALFIGAENNPDGHGYAILVPSEQRIITHRGLDSDAVIERFIKERELYPEGPALFHSRIGTAGDLKKQNCHPFMVGDDRCTVIAHNGVLPRKAQPDRDDFRSDTRLFAERYLPKGRFGHLRTKRGRRHVERWLGSGNKLVVLTVNERYYGATGGRGHAFILNERQGEWSNGVWYSNDSYRFLWQRFVSGNWRNDYRWGWDSDDYDYAELGSKTSEPESDKVIVKRSSEFTFGTGHDPSQDDCMFCGAKHALGAITGMCAYCNTCNECGDLREDCLCWVPRPNGTLGLDTDDPTAQIERHTTDDTPPWASRN